MADATFSEDFSAHTKKMIAELRAELAPYEDGNAEARRGPNCQEMTLTLDLIAQMKREIVALEDSLGRHGKNYA